MGKADMFRHGDWNVICDRCGFKFKASQCQMTWDGYFVCSKCWEPRHPQDFVRPKHDRLRVPIARNDPGVPYKTTTLGANAAKGAKALNVGSIADITQYSVLLIELDGPQDTQYFSTFVTTTPIVATNVVIQEELPYKATSGNTVYIFDNNDLYLSTNEVTTDDL